MHSCFSVSHLIWKVQRELLLGLYLILLAEVASYQEGPSLKRFAKELTTLDEDYEKLHQFATSSPWIASLEYLKLSAAITASLTSPGAASPKHGNA